MPLVGSRNLNPNIGAATLAVELYAYRSPGKSTLSPKLRSQFLFIFFLSREFALFRPVVPGFIFRRVGKAGRLEPAVQKNNKQPHLEIPGDQLTDLVTLPPIIGSQIVAIERRRGGNEVGLRHPGAQIESQVRKTDPAGCGINRERGSHGSAGQQAV